MALRSLRLLRFMLLLAAVGLAACAATERKPFEWDTLDWQGEFEPGDVLVLNNPYGNVRVRTSPYGDLSVRAVVQNLDPSIGQARLVSRYADGRIEVGVEAQGLDTPVGSTRFRADFTLNFPEEIALEAHLAEGDFQMHASDAPVMIRAARGNIRLLTSGRVDVEVLSGVVDYRPPADRGALAGGRIKTSEAGVNVIMPENQQLIFRTLSGVMVTSDSVQLLGSRRTVGREVILGPSEDVPEIVVQTDSGPIRIVTEGPM